jgi:hypothetical protein
MLDFGRMGSNYKPVVSLCETDVGRLVMREHTFPRCNAARTFSHVGLATGETFKRLSRSTRYERGNLRDVNNVSRRAVLLNPGYDDTSRSNRSVSSAFSSSSLRLASEP